jgi:DNA modification methylase
MIVVHQQDAAVRWPIDDATAAAVVFSPPYNAGVSYDADPDCDQMTWDEYRAMADAVMAETRRVLIEGGRCWINVTPTVPTTVRPAGDHSGQTHVGRTSLLAVWIAAADKAGLQHRDVIAWTTEGRGPGCAWGSYESPAGPNLRGEWEAIIACSRGPWARQTPDPHRGWRDGEGGWPRLTSNVWRVRPEHDRTHPAPFPVELARRCIRLSTWPGELVVDPFAGSGATLVAAQQLGRAAIGIERSPKYVHMCEQRVAQQSLFGTL